MYIYICIFGIRNTCYIYIYIQGQAHCAFIFHNVTEKTHQTLKGNATIDLANIYEHIEKDCSETRAITATTVFCHVFVNVFF